MILERLNGRKKLKSGQRKNGAKYWYHVAIISLVMIIIGLVVSYLFAASPNNQVSDDKLKTTIAKLKDQFPSLQHNLLKKISGAFLRLKTPGEPFVFLFLHDDNNKRTTDCLALYTSILAKQNIFTNTSKSLWMNASEWAQYSHQDNPDLLYEKVFFFNIKFECQYIYVFIAK